MRPSCSAAVVAAALLSSTLGLALPGVADAASSTAAQLVARSLAEARAETGVEWTTTATENAVTLTETTSAGKSGGRQSITISHDGEVGRSSAVLVGPVVYIKGNQLALENFLDFTTSAAAKEANRSVSISSTVAADRSEYDAVSGGLTVTSTVAELALAGPLSKLPSTTVAGKKVLALKGKAPSSSGAPSGTVSVLYVAASGKPLPVKEIEKIDGHTAAINLSHWGTVPSVKAPSKSVPFNTSWLTKS